METNVEMESKNKIITEVNWFDVLFFFLHHSFMTISKQFGISLAGTIVQRFLAALHTLV
jgi:hypothetical protein